VYTKQDACLAEAAEQQHQESLSPLFMARSAMDELSNSESAVRERKRREVKRRREMYLERLFSYEPPPEDDRTMYIRLAREECDLVEQIRVAHEAGIWRSIPDSVYETLLDGRFFWPKKAVVKEGAQFVPDKGIVLMALKLMHLYFIGATKYHGMILRDMYQVNGKEMRSGQSLSESIAVRFTLKSRNLVLRLRTSTTKTLTSVTSKTGTYELQR